MDIGSYIRTVNDFPKKGIVYRDITPLFLDPEVMDELVDQMLIGLEDKKIDKVVGIEARGFFLAPLLAKQLKAGFVPVRKAGKLPFTTYEQSYDLEYGKDRLQIHADAIQKGEKVLVHDDVLATGGTAKAACELIEKSGGEIVECNFLIELAGLNGRQKLQDFQVKSLFTYP